MLINPYPRLPAFICGYCFSVRESSRGHDDLVPLNTPRPDGLCDVLLLGELLVNKPTGASKVPIQTDVIDSRYAPITLFPPVTPTLQIISIGGTLPASANADASTPDLILPGSTVNVVVQATHVPSGTPVQIDSGGPAVWKRPTPRYSPAP
jgi:hypothetical protein